MQYNFEWDADKAYGNRAKHGVSFEEGATVFNDPLALTIYDEDHSGSEDRWLTIGLSAIGRVLVVCHSFREETRDATMVRLFSVRRAGRREKLQYEG